MEATRGNSCALLAANTCFNAHLCSPASLLWNSGCLAILWSTHVPSVSSTGCRREPIAYKILSPIHNNHVPMITTPDDHSSQLSPLPTTTSSQQSPHSHPMTAILHDHILRTIPSSQLPPQPPPLHQCHLLMTAVSSEQSSCGCHHHPHNHYHLSLCHYPCHTTIMLRDHSYYRKVGRIVQGSPDTEPPSDSICQPSPHLDPIAHGLAEGLVLRCSHWDTKSITKPRVCGSFSPRMALRMPTTW